MKSHQTLHYGRGRFTISQQRQVASQIKAPVRKVQPPQAGFLLEERDTHVTRSVSISPRDASYTHRRLHDERPTWIVMQTSLCYGKPVLYHGLEIAVYSIEMHSYVASGHKSSYKPYPCLGRWLRWPLSVTSLPHKRKLLSNLVSLRHVLSC